MWAGVWRESSRPTWRAIKRPYEKYAATKTPHAASAIQKRGMPALDRGEVGADEFFDFLFEIGREKPFEVLGVLFGDFLEIPLTGVFPEYGEEFSVPPAELFFPAEEIARLIGIILQGSQPVAGGAVPAYLRDKDLECRLGIAER